MTQAELADHVGTKQPGIARMERDDYGRWNLGTLQKLAFALDCRLKVSFETFGTLVTEAAAFNEANLQRPRFDDDPVFARSAETHVDPQVDNGPISEMRRKIAAWFANGATLDQLENWLLGYDLPPAGDELLPYQWLLEALTTQSASVREALAERVSVGILRREWDVRPPGGRLDLVENVLALAEGLAVPHVLGDPLLAALNRWDLSPIAPVGQPTLHAGHALVRAVTMNQPDSRFRTFWIETFLGMSSMVQLPENAACGFEGMARMGLAPNLEGIFDAVRRTQSWDLPPDVRIETVKSALQALWQRFPNHHSLPAEVVELATQMPNGWSRSTITALVRSLPLNSAVPDHLVLLLQETVAVANRHINHAVA